MPHVAGNLHLGHSHSRSKCSAWRHFGQTIQMLPSISGSWNSMICGYGPVHPHSVQCHLSSGFVTSSLLTVTGAARALQAQGDSATASTPTVQEPNRSRLTSLSSGCRAGRIQPPINPTRTVHAGRGPKPRGAGCVFPHRRQPGWALSKHIRAGIRSRFAM